MEIIDRLKSIVGLSASGGSPIKEDKSFVNMASLEEKIERSKQIIKAAFERFNSDKIVLAWTSGKDSTLILWMTRQICEENGFKLPKIMFINEGDVFPEMLAFAEKWGNEWGLKVDYVQNDDVLKQVNKLGDPVYIKKLNKRNKLAAKRLGYEKESFPFEPESLVGNHLMKTVAMSMYIEPVKAQAVITGIRWDEQEARANETYFSPRKLPKHMRIHPILHFREKDVWDVTHRYKIPYVELYEKGYRSLGARVTTVKPSDKPAWEQDLDHTTERIGRRQDKEQIMERLRDLGYM